MLQLEKKAGAKEDRLDLRLSPEDKRTIEAAAALAGMSVSSFIVSQALKAARHEIVAHEVIRLSDRDRDLFLSALENPPEPTGAFRKAVERHRALIQKG